MISIEVRSITVSEVLFFDSRPISSENITTLWYESIWTEISWDADEAQAYLAGWRTGNPPHCGYHRKGAGGLVGALLPGRWVIGVRAVTVGKGQKAGTAKV